MLFLSMYSCSLTKAAFPDPQEKEQIVRNGFVARINRKDHIKQMKSLIRILIMTCIKGSRDSLKSQDSEKSTIPFQLNMPNLEPSFKSQGTASGKCLLYFPLRFLRKREISLNCLKEKEENWNLATI